MTKKMTPPNIPRTTKRKRKRRKLNSNHPHDNNTNVIYVIRFMTRVANWTVTSNINMMLPHRTIRNYSVRCAGKRSVNRLNLSDTHVHIGNRSGVNSVWKSSPTRPIWRNIGVCTRGRSRTSASTVRKHSPGTVHWKNTSEHTLENDRTSARCVRNHSRLWARTNLTIDSSTLSNNWTVSSAVSASPRCISTNNTYKSIRKRAHTSAPTAVNG